MKVDKLGKQLSLLATIIFTGMACYFLGMFTVACYVRMTIRDYYLNVVLGLITFATFFFGLAFFTDSKEVHPSGEKTQ